MTEGFGLSLPWWGWVLLGTGAVALIGVIGALFLPDWPTPDPKTDFRAPAGSPEFVEHLAAFVNVPILRGDTATILQNGDAFFPAMLEAIRGARDTVNFETYIFEDDAVGWQFIDAFIERARAGVEVRLLLDAFGSIKLGKAARAKLRDAGVRLEWFRPLGLRHLVRMYRRTHRRAIVVDGRVAFTGGAAVAKKWAGDVRTPHEWRDNMTRVTGPLAAGIQAAFATNWLYCTSEVLLGPRFYPESSGALSSSSGALINQGPTGTDQSPMALSVISSPSDAAHPIRLVLWFTFINAQRRLWISNSYFIPDEHLRHAVMDRARAGVDVRILVPGNRTDAVPVWWAGRSFYEELLEAGVRIFEFQPAMMHAKTVMVDGCWSIVGSANMDERSLELNEENILAVADAQFAADLERGVAGDLERSTEIRLEEWRRRSPIKRVLERLATALLEQY